MKTKELDWNSLRERAEQHGIVIGQSTDNCGVTRFYAFKEGERAIGEEPEGIKTSHFGGHWDFNHAGWFESCEEFVRKHEVQERWDKRQHKHAISRAYDALCVLAESLGLDWCLAPGSALECNIIINPSDPKAGLEIISTEDSLVELHAENLRTLGGKLTRRWNYTVVTVHGGGGAHDDPPPAVEESKPLPLDAAVRQFAIAALSNKVAFATINL